MDITQSLVFARQQASKARGNFYVTDSGVKQQHELKGSAYHFKVYKNEKGIYIEDQNGKTIEKPTSTPKLRKPTTKKAGKNDERKRAETPFDIGEVAE